MSKKISLLIILFSFIIISEMKGQKKLLEKLSDKVTKAIDQEIDKVLTDKNTTNKSSTVEDKNINKPKIENKDISEKNKPDLNNTQNYKFIADDATQKAEEFKKLLEKSAATNKYIVLFTFKNSNDFEAYSSSFEKRKPYIENLKKDFLVYTEFLDSPESVVDKFLISKNKKLNYFQNITILNPQNHNLIYSSSYDIFSEFDEKKLTAIINYSIEIDNIIESSKRENKNILLLHPLYDSYTRKYVFPPFNFSNEIKNLFKLIKLDVQKQGEFFSKDEIWLNRFKPTYTYFSGLRVVLPQKEYAIDGITVDDFQIENQLKIINGDKSFLKNFSNASFEDIEKSSLESKKPAFILLESKSRLNPHVSSTPMQKSDRAFMIALTDSSLIQSLRKNFLLYKLGGEDVVYPMANIPKFAGYSQNQGCIMYSPEFNIVRPCALPQKEEVRNAANNLVNDIYNIRVLQRKRAENKVEITPVPTDSIKFIHFDNKIETLKPIIRNTGNNGKKIIIYTRSSYSQQSLYMENKIFKNEAVIKFINKNFDIVWLIGDDKDGYINLEEKHKIINTLRIPQIPNLTFMDPFGKINTRNEGWFEDPNQFIQFCEQWLDKKIAGNLGN